MNRQENRESSKILNAKGNTTKPKSKPWNPEAVTKVWESIDSKN